tara:strand:+ start:3429 stop:3743 length:315 start_codon:yes stop_codon:yes gene_type:complete
MNNNSNIINNLNTVETHQENKSNYSFKKNINYIFKIFIFLWITSGILGFLISLFCLIYNDNKLSKILGLLLASIFFGPLYWFYYIYMDNYCSIKPIYKLKKYKL